MASRVRGRPATGNNIHARVGSHQQAARLVKTTGGFIAGVEKASPDIAGNDARSHQGRVEINTLTDGAEPSVSVVYNYIYSLTSLPGTLL